MLFLDTGKNIPQKLNDGNDGNTLYAFNDLFHKNSNNLAIGFFHENTWPIGMHSHEFYEVNIVTSGYGVHYISDKKIPIKIGDIFMLPPAIKHGYYNIEELQLYNLLLSNSFFQRFSYETERISGLDFLMNIEPVLRASFSLENHIHVTSEGLIQLIPLLKLLERIHLNELQEYANGNENGNDYVLMNSLSLYILSYICKYHTDSQEHLNKYSKESIIALSLEYIHRNFCNQIHINELAKISNLSLSTFLRYFKEIVKNTPNAYIKDLRLEHSKKLLETTKLSIATIANDCGFFDSSHFELYFKRKYGQTPKSYRESIKNGAAAHE